MVNIYNGTLFNYSAGVYVGCLVKESTMRKLAKLQAEHERAVKRLLADEAERGNVFAAGWTLHYPNGQQTTVNFIDTTADIKSRIDVATHSHRPTAVPLVFVAKGMSEAKEMADKLWQQTQQEGASNEEDV